MCCLFCFTFFRRIPRKQCLDHNLLGQVCILSCFHQPGQVAIWVQAIFNGGLDQAEHDGAAGSTLGGIGEQEILSVKGYLHTDGYAVYHGLPEGITVVGCHAHLRRKFDEAIKSLPKGKAKGSSAYQGLAYCDMLFAIEKGLDEKNATPEERYKERLEQAKPVLDAMLSWANSRTAAPKSALGKAFTYLKEQWPYLTNYLKDGRLELSNNRAERSIKPFVISRKNFLFANTPKGATGSAIMFSLIQTAIENGLEPYKYLTWLMKTAKDADLEDTTTVQALLPWNAPEECL